MISDGGAARRPSATGAFSPLCPPACAQEEERGSSAEGSGDEDEGSDEEEGSDEDDEESPSARRRPRKKHKPFVAPPPRALPQRTTRGARMGTVVADEGDEEFWVGCRRGRLAYAFVCPHVVRPSSFELRSCFAPQHSGCRCVPITVASLCC